MLRRYTDYLAEVESYLKAKVLQVKDTFKIIKGGTHDFPALAWTLTDEDVFFKPVEGEMIPLDTKEGIDCFNDKKGDFYVRQGRLNIVEWKVWMHDTFGCDF